MTARRYPRANVFTTRGVASVEVIAGDQIELHCHLPPCGGGSLFMVFELSTDLLYALTSMSHVIHLGPHEPDQDLTPMFNFAGCLVVGAGPKLIDTLRIEGLLKPDGYARRDG